MNGIEAAQSGKLKNSMRQPGPPIPYRKGFWSGFPVVMIKIFRKVKHFVFSPVFIAEKEECRD
jgi:hypothetical protein